MASNARDDVLCPSLLHLIGPLRVGEQISGKADKVGFALPEDLLGQIRISHLPRGDDRNLHSLLGHLRQIDRASSGLSGRGLNPIVCLITSTIDRQRIDSCCLKPACNLKTFLYVSSPLQIMSQRILEQDREISSRSPLHGGNEFQGQSESAVQGPHRTCPFACSIRPS